MARTESDEEPNYLAGAQPKDDPREFRYLVREAFALEYETTKDYQIAAVIGRDKSRIAQVLKRPNEAESVTIRHLISFLKSSEHRQKIVNAWARAYFPLIGSADKPTYLSATATERTRRRIDRLIREGQLALASRVCLEAITKANTDVLREELLDRAYFLLQRLDQPGQAMRIARLIAERARQHGVVEREVAAALMRCRILLGLADSTPSEVLPILAWADDALRNLKTTEAPSFLWGSRERIEMLRDSALVTFAERRVVTGDEATIREILARSRSNVQTARSYQARSDAAMLSARCHLVLGERFQAEEFLEVSFKSGDVKNLHAYEISGLFLAKVLAQSDAPPEEQEVCLSQVIENCQASLDRYHQRLAEWDLARLEARQFPAVP